MKNTYGSWAKMAEAMAGTREGARFGNARSDLSKFVNGKHRSLRVYEEMRRALPNLPEPSKIHIIPTSEEEYLGLISLSGNRAKLTSALTFLRKMMDAGFVEGTDTLKGVMETMSLLAGSEKTDAEAKD